MGECGVNTLTCMHNLASLLASRGQVEEAVALEAECLAKRRELRHILSCHGGVFGLTWG